MRKVCEMHIITSHIDFSSSAVVMNLSHLRAEQKRSEVIARLMLLKHIAGPLHRCWALQHALSAGGCSLHWKHMLRSFVNQLLGWKPLRQSTAVLKNASAHNKWRKKMFAINTDERPKPGADYQCSAWSTSDHYCVIGVGGLQGCPDSSCQWENEERVSCISSGS